MKHGADFKANTEPTAQYEDPGPLREIRDPKTGKLKRVEPVNAIIGPDGKEVQFRHIEGHDVDSDGRVDLGRLAMGTYTFYRGKYKKQLALRPRGSQTVERDTNHDGTFTHDDMWHTDKGDVVIETGNDLGILVHIGSNDNTFSGGCQTLPPKEHAQFFNKLKKEQKNYYYVLFTLK